MQFRHSLAKPVLSAAVVVFFFLAAGLGIWGAVEVRTDSDMTAYFIDDSFALQFLQMREKYWLARAPLDIITEHLAEEGFFSEARLAELDALIADLEALDCVSPPHDNWIWDFQAHIETSHNATAEEELDRLRGDPAAFGSAVADFLKRSPFLHDGRLVMPSHHRRNIRIEGGLVRASRQSLQYDADFSMQKRYISNFQRTHAVVFPQGAGSGDTFSGARVPRTFEVAHIMLTAERDARMKELVFTSLGVACAAVCGVVVFVLNPILGFYIGFLVLSLDAMVLAMLIVYDIGLDVLAYLSVALTLGLVVDYSTHTAHSYLHCDGSPAERLDFSVRTMGASIISAGGSTLLGIMALAAAASEGYRIYFRVLATAVGLGTFFGVLVSPVVLCSLHRLALWLGMRRHEKRPEPDAQSV